jgi:hypothetical protein
MMRTFFLSRVLIACLGASLRRAAVLAVLFLCLGLLSASAPALQACNEANAAFVIRTTVFRDVPSNGTTINVPAGSAAAWSCVSRDDAEGELQRQIALIK